MPTLRKDRGNAWMGRVVIDGKQVDCKFFPPGKPKGPEWLAARQWEVDRKKELLASQGNQVPTLSGLELLLAWGEQYLDFAKRTMSRSTYVEKTTVMKALFAFCRDEGIGSIERLTKQALYQFLVEVSDAHTARRANVYRKNLLAAWNWGIDSVDGFPQGRSVLERIKPFPVDAGERYVPPEEDVVKVLRVARGQDLVMLLTYYYTGARRSEVFRLSWEKDIRLDTGQIRLIDHKGRNGQQRVRWLSMHPELIKALKWWWNARPCKVDNVFMQTQSDSYFGQPFKQRLHLMNRLCARAGVKPFGFHALRHKAAAITFIAGGLNAAQILMGHSRATTTDIYVRSAGLYSNQESILSALGESSIGQAAEELLKMEMEMPLEEKIRGASCNQGQVTTLVQ